MTRCSECGMVHMKKPDLEKVTRPKVTALSIPERAREIAERKHEKYFCQYSTGECEPENYFCKESINALVETATEAMHSEREVCAKELRDEAKRIDDGRAKNVAEAGALNRAAEWLLREGGQK